MHLSSLPLPTAEEMRRWDSETVALGIPECLLMENAAREALHVLQQLQVVEGKRILLFMGPGNNGGDAACLARHLLDLGALPLVLHTRALDTYAGVTQEHITMATACGVSFIFIGQEGWQETIPKEWHFPHIIVDGLLGTGFEGDLRPTFAEYITYINGQKEQGEGQGGAFIFALDIPSGCHALQICADAVAVQAHATVCFAAAKPSLVLPEAKPYTGQLFVRAIGIPQKIQKTFAPSYGLVCEKSLGTVFHKQKPQSHKGSWGHTLILAGSEGLTGAAHLTALAALRTGAGLVTVGAPQGVCAEIKGNNPNIMTLPLRTKIPQRVQGDENNLWWPQILPTALCEKLTQVDALAVGPGMGTGESALAFLFALLKFKQRPPTIFDADALTLLARHKELLAHVRAQDICTPHPGEAARFLESTAAAVQWNRFDAIRCLSQLAPCVWLLKGAGTLIKQEQSQQGKGQEYSQNSGPIYILGQDIPALAVAGSGDVLTGCMVSCRARFPEHDGLTLTALAASVHATAGKMLQEQYPQRGHTASDIAHILPAAMQRMSCQ